MQEEFANYPIKIQVIRSKNVLPRFYVNIPMPLAAALDLQGGEEVQWQILSRSDLRLRRCAETPIPSKKPKKRT
jgi:hypothetical protein